MAILHKNISAEGDIHNPKWFSGANNGDVAWRNELGVLESTDELVLPAALDFVDGSVAPPTSNSGDIYVLSSGGSVNAGWGTVSLGDWVRYDGTTWNVITPQKSSLCYNETTDALNSYDGSTWSAIGSGGGGGGGGDSIYTADGTLTGNRTVDLDGNDLNFEGNSGLNIDNTSVNNSKALISLSKGMSNNSSRSTYIEGLQSTETRNYWKIFLNGSYNFNQNNGIGFYKNNTLSQGTEYTQKGIYAVNHPLLITNYTNSTPRMTLYGGTTNVTGNGYLKFWNYNAGSQKIQIARSGKNFINPDTLGGMSDAGFIVMGDTYVGTEKISLQGSTLIKGNGTSTGSALAIYDNDTTPNKLLDFLDNGNIGVSQSSSFLLSANKTLKVDGSLNTGTTKVFEINAGSHPIFGNGAVTVGTFGNVEIKGTNSSGNFKVLTILGNEYFTLDGNGNNSTLRTKAFDVGTTTTTGYKMSIDAGNHKFIRNTIVGAHFKLESSDVLFWEQGIENRTFVVGGATPIGTEEISLQGDTLLNANVNMPNLPTSATGLSSGDLWNDGGTLKIA
jgi:hypothetical protein